MDESCIDSEKMTFENCLFQLKFTTTSRMLSVTYYLFKNFYENMFPVIEQFLGLCIGTYGMDESCIDSEKMTFENCLFQLKFTTTSQTLSVTYYLFKNFYENMFPVIEQFF